jgi:poly-gamma-glutamate capsule biosynthesis protein CapA/YwtB (metallophosphatase superfamily)
MILSIFFGIILLILLASYLITRYPLPAEGDLETKSIPFFYLYYASKYLWLIKKPPINSNLDHYFAKTKKTIALKQLHDSSVVTLKFAGDLMPHKQLEHTKAQSLWMHIGPYLFDADFTVGNLEFAINDCNKIYGYKRFSVASKTALPLLDANPYGKFNLVSLANNHINDSFQQGVQKTCEYLETNNILFVGANRTKREQDDFPIVTIKGIKIAFLAYTFTTNNIKTQNVFDVNHVKFNTLNDEHYDDNLIKKHIQKAKKSGADFIILINHWGLEFEYYPSKKLIQRAHRLMDLGADLIIGHHPHVINPAQWYVTKDQRQAICFYSLGNITTCSLKGDLKQLSEIIEISLEQGYDHKNKKIVQIKSVLIKPTYFLKNAKQLKIVPLYQAHSDNEEYSFLTNSEQKALSKAKKEYDVFFKQPGFDYI